MYRIILFIALTTLILSGSAFALGEDFYAGMSHAEFAKQLIRELEIENLLPPAAVTKDYFDLLTELGIEPEDGWDFIDGIITIDDLKSMTGAEEAGLTFTELIDMVKERLFDVLWVRTGSRPGVSPAMQ